MANEQRGSVIESVQRLFDAGTLSALSESQLLERFLTDRDKAAFEAILLRHGGMVLGVCRRVLHNPHDVDDAFQATFLVLVEKARSIRDREVLGVWLHGVARRVAVRAKVNSRRRKAQERSGTEGTDVEDARGDHAEVNELRSVIDDEVERLPHRYRAPLVLCDIEGQTHEQAAAQLRCPVGTIKSRLSRGRERLRSRLIRRGVAPSAGLLASTLAAESASAMPTSLLNHTLIAATHDTLGQAATAGVISAEAFALAKGAIRSMGFFKLKVAAFAVLVLGLTAAGARTFIHKTTDSPDRKGANNNEARLLARANNGAPSILGAEQFQLDNGLKVILRPIQGADQTVLNVIYSIGEDFDPEGRSGLAHLLEHVYVTAAAGQQKERTIQEFMRRYTSGGNAQTGDRYTVFSTSFPPKNLDDELKDAAARMGDLRVSDGDLKRERPRLLQEVTNMFSAFPSLAAVNNAHELVRPAPGTGRKGGVRQQVEALTKDQIQTYWQQYYKPCNATLALAGSLDPKAARRTVETYFAKLPPGEKIPAPREPGKPKFGEVYTQAIRSPLPNAESTASLAYLAPQPASDLYAPFLVLVTRLWSNANKLGNSGPTGSPIFFTPLDNPNTLAVTVPLETGESSAQVLARLESFVAKTLEPKLGPEEIEAAQQQLGFLLGTMEIPDQLLAQNPYGVIFSIVRRKQLGLDPAKLSRALKAVTDADLRKAAREVFAPSRHTGAIISLEK